MKNILLVIILTGLTACISAPVVLKNDDENIYLKTTCLYLDNSITNQQNIFEYVRVQYTNEYQKKIYYVYEITDFISLDENEPCNIKANITAIESKLNEVRRASDLEASDEIILTVQVSFVNNTGILFTKSYMTKKNSEFTSGIFNTYKTESNKRITSILGLAYKDIINQIQVDLERLR